MCVDETSCAIILASHVHLGREKVTASRVEEALTISNSEPHTPLVVLWFNILFWHTHGSIP